MSSPAHFGSQHFPGQEYLLSDSDQLTHVGAARPGHGSHQATSSSSTTTSLTSPASTLVGSSTGLQIKLLWDSSVRSNANWAKIEASVVAAAKIYTDTFSNHDVINIAVGLGEVGGSKMSSNALGESESYGYLTNFNTVFNSLQSADAGLTSGSQLSADNPPTGANFFVTSAEAKALGLVSGTSTSIDGYIGIGSSSAIYWPTTGSSIGSGQYDAVGVAAHEISEVMGRIGMEGQSLGTTHNVYTPLDLFRFSSNGVRDLTPTSGYFSVNDGQTNLGIYNNPANGGDAADWATLSTNHQDAYNAFGTPGVMNQVTPNDLVQVQSLGYQLSLIGIPTDPIPA